MKASATGMVKGILILLCCFAVTNLQYAQEKNGITYFSNKTRLLFSIEQYRKGLKQNEYNIRALLKEADRGLRGEPLSVMMKAQLPPSGDKHDYMSLAPYWWPDSTKKDGLPYIRKDGERNPEKNLISDHAYFTKTCSTIYQLSLACLFTRETKYARKADTLIRHWFLNSATRMNPNMNFAQAVKGRNTGRGSGIIESRHIFLALDGIMALHSMQALSEGVFTGVQLWARQFSVWLKESPNGKDEHKAENNHGTWYGVQALSLALFLNDAVSQRQLAGELRVRVREQITPEGMQPEELGRTNSLSYSHFNLRALFTYWILIRSAGLLSDSAAFPEAALIKSAIEFHLPFALGEKQWTYMQIHPADPADLAEVYFYAYYFWRDKKYLEAVKKLSPEFLKKSFLPLVLTG